jgi:hypothetical protein
VVFALLYWVQSRIRVMETGGKFWCPELFVFQKSGISSAEVEEDHLSAVFQISKEIDTLSTDERAGDEMAMTVDRSC